MFFVAIRFLTCIASFAVDLSVRSLAAGDRVKLASALDAGETVAVEGSDFCWTFLRLEDLALAAWAAVRLPGAPHDGLGIHPALVLRLSAVAELDSVTVPAEDLPVRSVEESGGVKRAATVGAAQAILVVRTRLGIDPLRLKHFAWKNYS